METLPLMKTICYRTSIVVKVAARRNGQFVLIGSLPTDAASGIGRVNQRRQLSES